MEIYLVNTRNGLMPAYSSDADEKSKLKIGKVYVVDIREVRNPKMHKRFMALIQAVFENQNQFTSEKMLRKHLLIQAGFYEERVNEAGIKYPEAISMNFEEMDEIEFRQVFDRVLDVIVFNYKWSGKEINEMINEYMGFDKTGTRIKL